MVALIVGATAAALAGYYLPRRTSVAKAVWVVSGFVLVAWPTAAWLLPDRLYFLYPSFSHGSLLFASSFLLIGVLLRLHSDLSRKRIAIGVLTVVLAYSVFADPIHFAFAAREIRALHGRADDGVTIQSEHYTCVPASLATVLRLWGIDLTEGDLAYRLRTAFQGTHPARVPYVVEEVGASHGLRARVISTCVAELRERDLPVILLGYEGRVRHAVALLAMDASSITIGNPLHGRVQMEIAKWQRDFRWTGQAVVVEPIEPLPAGVPRPRLSAT